MKRAVVLLSGGLDSATVAAEAVTRYDEVFGLSFRYGQRHTVELRAAERLAARFALNEHRIVDVDLAQLGHSSLTDPRMAVPSANRDDRESEIPSTYVPARNTVFIAYGLAMAEVLDAEAILIGVNAVDYSGYPDCRPEFVSAYQSLIDVATRRTVTGRPLRLEAPLLRLSKSAIIRWGTRLGVDYSMTISCYEADEQGFACGQCDSCLLRRQGFADADIADPTLYKVVAESGGAEK